MNPGSRPAGSEAGADGTVAYTVDEPEGWRTGTAIDEFTPIYLHLAKTSPLHGPIPPGDADLLDLAVIAALLGVGSEGHDFDAASADVMRRRMEAAREGRQFTWEDAAG